MWEAGNGNGGRNSENDFIFERKIETRVQRPIFKVVHTFRDLTGKQHKIKKEPVHFILRLKSLEKAVPTYDLTDSSFIIINEKNTKSNPVY